MDRKSAERGLKGKDRGVLVSFFFIVSQLVHRNSPVRLCDFVSIFMEINLQRKFFFQKVSLSCYYLLTREGGRIREEKVRGGLTENKVVNLTSF
jgi:hypothetical protein